MRTLLAIIGAFALLSFGIIGGVLFYLGMRAEPVAAESAVYADEAIAAITENWDEAVFIEHAAPEMMTTVDAATRRRFLEFARLQYGAQVAYEPAAVCALQSYVLTFAGEVAVANCVSQGRFERGEVAFRVGVVKRRGAWRVFAFYADIIGEQAPARQAPVIASGPAGAAKLLASSIEVSVAGRYVALNGPAAGGLETGVGDDKIRALTKEELLSGMARE